MSRSFFITIRREEYEVVIDHDYGYESDTNVHQIDWHVVDCPFELTDNELDTVDDKAHDFCYERRG
jgi:hypothetical protein